MNVYDNIAFLIKSKGIPIGNVEKELGVSTGYFSRARKAGGMTAEMLYRASRYFGVTMDELYTGSFKAEIIKDEIRRLERELKEIEQG